MMTSLTRLLLVVYILIHAACGGEPTWALWIEDWPENAEVLEVHSWVNERETDSFVVSRERGTRGFGVRLPEGFTGRVKLRIWALDSTGCKVATRDLQQDLRPGLRVTVEEPPIRLASLPDAVCPLEIVKNEDNFVYVTSEPPGIDCGARCKMEITRGHLVRLTAQAGIAVSWSTPKCRVAKFPSPDCTVAIDGGTKLFASRYELLKPTMKAIEHGSFSMGEGVTDSHGDSSQWNTPSHSVDLLNDFEISETEITQQNYSLVMGENPSFFNGKPDLPVESVSWLDAARYCNRLSFLEGRESCYLVSESSAQWKNGQLCSGYRLPTEAEWEYAAKAGRTMEYAGADCKHEPGKPEVHNYIWLENVACFSMTSNGRTCQLKNNINKITGTIRAIGTNAFCLYGMSGNVSEWVWDGFAYYDSSGRSQRDPTGNDLSSYRSIRGGSYNSAPGVVRQDMSGRLDYAGVNIVAELRTTARNRQPATHKSPTIGFRIARTILPTEPRPSFADCLPPPKN